VVETKPKSGFHLAVCFPAGTQAVVKVVAFRRSLLGKETGITATVEIKIIDSAGSIVREATLTTDESTGTAMWPIPEYPLPPGGYAIVANAKIGRQELTAKNYIVSQVGVEENKGPDANIYGISLNSNGYPVDKSFSVVGGEIVSASNGAWTIKTSTTTIPFEIVLQSESFEAKVAKPNPFTRVVFIIFPDNSP
jgi:hypothetical protein